MDAKPQKHPNINDIDLEKWCSLLNCTEDQIRYCIGRVGTSWVSVEAFWTMNASRIRKSIPEN